MLIHAAAVALAKLIHAAAVALAKLIHAAAVAIGMFIHAAAVALKRRAAVSTREQHRHRQHDTPPIPNSKA